MLSTVHYMLVASISVGKPIVSSYQNMKLVGPLMMGKEEDLMYFPPTFANLLIVIRMKAFSDQLFFRAELSFMGQFYSSCFLRDFVLHCNPWDA